MKSAVSDAQEIWPPLIAILWPSFLGTTGLAVGDITYFCCCEWTSSVQRMFNTSVMETNEGKYWLVQPTDGALVAAVNNMLGLTTHVATRRRRSVGDA